MSALHNAILADNGLFSFGGFTCVRPREWRHYLQRVLGDATLPEEARPQQNDCILTSLEKYLLAEFGVFIPTENLFQFYNAAGDGISPQQMVEVISAVIEPLGFEIERMMVPDPELREALGGEGRAVSLEESAAFQGRAGIGMINIEAGYSHAFFWPHIDPRRFTAPQFRMAVLVKRTDASMEEHVPAFSAIGSLETYAAMVREAVDQGRICPSERAAILTYALDELLGSLQCEPDPSSREFRASVDGQLAAINQSFRAGISAGENEEDDHFTAEIGEMVRRIFREVARID